MDFDYKKHSLERLEEWMNDALLSSEASPQEIYDVIKKATEENYHYFKNHTERCYELLTLLNGNGRGHIKAYDNYLDSKSKMKCDKDDPSPECKDAWNDFWEEQYCPEEVKDDGMRPWGHSDMEYQIANNTQSDHSKYYYEYDRNSTDRPNPFVNEVKKWILPVEMDNAAGDAAPIYYVNFPDDLLEAANLKEGDEIEWLDNKDGAYILKKVEQPSWVKGNELARVKTYQEMIDDGWTMTDDGFWIKED